MSDSYDSYVSIPCSVYYVVGFLFLPHFMLLCIYIPISPFHLLFSIDFFAHICYFHFRILCAVHGCLSSITFPISLVQSCILHYIIYAVLLRSVHSTCICFAGYYLFQFTCCLTCCSSLVFVSSYVHISFHFINH